MRRLKFLITVLAIMASANVWAGGKLYSIRTNSLDCDFCAYELEETFMKMKGVKDFEVDLEGILLIRSEEHTSELQSH